MPDSIAIVQGNPEIACHLSLSEYIQFCCTGRLPQRIRDVFGTESFLRDEFCAEDIVGALEPLSAIRPGVCDPVIHYERNITVGAASVIDAVVFPFEVKVISFCAPINRTLVIEQSRVTAINSVARIQPVSQPIYKNVNLGTFGAWCLPFEPEDSPGSFVNIEHIIVPPGAGFSIYLQNHIGPIDAQYHYEARFWTTC